MAKAALKAVEQSVLIEKAEAFLQANTPTAPPIALSPLQMQQDTALEYDSMVLLSKVEQLLMRLQDTLVQASVSLFLEGMVAIANHLIAFTEQLPMAAAKRFSIDALLVRDRANYTQLGPQHVRNRRLDFEVFTELHLPQGRLRHPKTFEQLNHDVLRVNNLCLNICVKAFHAPEMRQQWRTVYSGFLVHLARIVQHVQSQQPSA
ncbi:MAG: hypothetical protein AB7N91_26735 [Candidatus Tectimicrobiota bacterium]